MPNIGDVVATTDLGTLKLKEAIADPRSRLQAIAVPHKGNVVYEEYPGMPRDSHHLWSSTAKTITGLLIYQLVEEGRINLRAPCRPTSISPKVLLSARSRWRMFYTCVRVSISRKTRPAA
jgi:hypothetical protein